MQHTVLYRSSQAIGATNASLTAIGFSQDVVTNNKILLQNDMRLMFATVFGVGVGFSRIQTPYLINMGSLHIRPFGILGTAGNNPNTGDFSQNPTLLRATENIDLQTTNTDAGAQIHTGILQLWDGASGVPNGQRLKLLATSIGPATAGAWTRINLTYQDNLPNIMYSIIGMEVFSATGLVARLDIPGQAYKPGVPVVNAIQNRAYWKQYIMPFGELGRFRNQALPALEIFCTGADAVFDVWLDVVALG
jgi:hypothetical protein